MSTPTGIGFFLPKVSKQARMVAYIALRQDGKVKMNERRAKERLQDAVLGDCLIDEKSGEVAWVAGVIHVESKDDFQVLAKCVRKLFEGDGVEFDLIKHANELLDRIEEKEFELRELEKAAKGAEVK